MGKATCWECKASGVEVRPVRAGCLICLLCLVTYSTKWQPKTQKAKEEWKKDIRDPGFVTELVKDHFLRGVSERRAEIAKKAAALVGQPRSAYKCNEVILKANDMPLNSGNMATIYESKDFVSVKEADLQPGDTVIFKKSPTDDTVNHGGVYVGTHGKVKYFVHSPNSGVQLGMSTDFARKESPEKWGDLIIGYRRRKK